MRPFADNPASLRKEPEETRRAFPREGSCGAARPIPAGKGQRTAESGMTLLEVILAIAVAGFVLAAATSFVVSISTIWVEREDRHFFEDHVDGVTEFIRAAFTNAGVEIALEDANSPGNGGPEGAGDGGENGDEPGTPRLDPVEVGDRDPADQSDSRSGGGGLVRSQDEPVGWARPPGFAEYQDPLLNFRLTEPPPLLVGLDNAPVLGIDAFLHFERDEGLSLLWYSMLQEESEDLGDLRRTEISSIVTGIRYIYWDERFENWEETDAPKEGEGDQQFLLPRFIKLIFEYENEVKERTITIPVPSRSALIF